METTTKTYYLAKFSDNWADEIDLHGFVLTDDKEELLKTTREWFKECEGHMGFGSNQGKQYRSYEEMMKRISFKKMTKDEYQTLKKFFPSSYGFGEIGPLGGW
jgi:hypothetical protein